MQVHVVRTGVANLASVLAALQRAGAEVTLTDDPAMALRADRVLLPGVGHFGAARQALAELGLDEALFERIHAARPTLAICLGLQLFARASEESPDAAGLGVFASTVTAFPRDRGVRVPQMGWNEVTPRPDSRLIQPGFAYYANTYKLDHIPEGWSGATSVHGVPFVAAVERGPVLACQFHPELSGAWGAALLARWMEA
jgi:imidazole glycerol phosphate synthase glutamine amidotransferase subunit